MSHPTRNDTILGASLVALSSLAFAIFTLGLRPLNIFDIDWIVGDFADIDIAWIQYISTHRAFSLISDRMSYPLPMNFALFDPIPILLFLLAPIGRFVPSHTQYIGWYLALSLAAQGVFGYLAASEFIGPDDEGRDRFWNAVSKIAAGLLCALAPFTIFRFTGHLALSSQWLLVMSIWIWMRTQNWKSDAKWILANGAALLLATGFNVYLTFMVALSTFTLTIVSSPKTPATYLRVFLLAIIGSIGLFVFGFIDGAGVPIGGYGLYSMNMAGPIDSNGWATILKFDVPDATGGQGEGFTYLGLGTLLLFAISTLSVMFRKANSSARFPLLAAVAVVLISYALALSTTVTLGRHIFEIPVPKHIIAILSSIRVSGRLFWIGAFWILLGSIGILRTRFSNRSLGIILIFIITVQIVDVGGVATYFRGTIHDFHRITFAPPTNAVPTRDYNALIVLPPWQCGPASTPGGVRGYEPFGYFAVDRNIPTNDFYAARTRPEQMAFHCDFERATSSLDRSALYIVSSGFLATYRAKFAPDFNCLELADPKDSFACTAKAP